MPRKRRKRPAGLGTITERGGSFRVRWREGGRQRSRTFPTRELAERVLAKILGDIAQGRAGLPPDPREVPRLSVLGAEWLKRREATHRAIGDDKGRWSLHLEPYFGGMRPSEVTPALIRAFVEAKLATLSPTTVGHCVRLFSSFFTDLVERGLSPTNPVRALPRSTRRLFRNAHDPKDTPFLERRDDVRRVFLALHARSEHVGVAFAIGALAGLRTSEVLGLEWSHIDLEARRIHVRQQAHRGRLAPLKDRESRIVPLVDSLLPILRTWHVRTGGTGLVVPPRYGTRGGRPGSPPMFMREHTLGDNLRKALKTCELEGRGLNWYRCTRHTFASQWVMDGRPIEKLRVILGHESVSTTERYAHLRPDAFNAQDLGAVAVDLTPPSGRVLPLAPRPRPEAHSDPAETSVRPEGIAQASEAS